MRHLLLARTGRGLASTAQLLQERHRPRGGLGHVQIAHLRQLDDLRVGDDADEGVARGRARAVRSGRIGGDVLLDEQKVRHDDVAVPHRRLARAASAAGFSAHSAAAWTEISMPGKSRASRGGDARGGARGVGVQRHDDDAVASAGSMIGGHRA
ncbi:MAG: hypothetical protein U5J82_15820 [Desulfobacterales bacterium]|nr:hypothetical protein [Desulfobacterales bacterium]